MKHWRFLRNPELIKTFKVPLFILGGIVLSFPFFYVFHNNYIGNGVLLVIIGIGSFDLAKSTIQSIIHKKFALDYIALLAITVGIVSGHFLVAAVIVLMLSGGITLEEYGTSLAKKSLTALTNRIPNDVYLWKNNHITKKVSIQSITIEQDIAIRKGEVVPLDGNLFSKTGVTDESSLTGEPYYIEKYKGDVIRSGTVNMGDTIVVRVSRVEKDSTYRKIIQMVQDAQEQKSPLIRLADKYSVIFTIVTLLLSLLAYLISHDFTKVLAVLVIATPCPLILATPIALMGGMNLAAKSRIIMKNLSSIEILSRVNTLVFDKTGTLTLGRPFVKNIHVTSNIYSKLEILSIAESIERNSLHPLAKAVGEAARKTKAPIMHATMVKEEIGKGINGVINGKTYSISKVEKSPRMAVQIQDGNTRLAVIEFEDKLKDNSINIVRNLKKLGLFLHIFTGDKKESAQEIVNQISDRVVLHADMSPQDKKDGIIHLKKAKNIVAMIGDGINDAPALAAADVGMVFSNEEQTAASEAADIVFLGGDLSDITRVIAISKRTLSIAKQSIIVGIGISIVGMTLAAFGYIPPVAGAFMQETIDILVIINALRTSRK